MKDQSKPELMINNRTAKELAYVKFKRGYEDGSIILQQKHMNSVMGAISFAFFLALFSAGDNASTNIFLKISEVLFAIGLISNVLLFFHYQATSDRKIIWEIDCTSFMAFYKLIALFTPVLGALFLIVYYYILAAACAVITVGLGFITFKLSLRAVISNDAKFSQYELGLIDAGKFEEYEKAKDREFVCRLSPDELTTNCYRYKITVQSSGLSEEISLHHQATVGDIIQLSDTKKYSVVNVVHSKHSTSLDCEAIVECAGS